MGTAVRADVMIAMAWVSGVAADFGAKVDIFGASATGDAGWQETIEAKAMRTAGDTKMFRMYLSRKR